MQDHIKKIISYVLAENHFRSNIITNKADLFSYYKQLYNNH